MQCELIRVGAGRYLALNRVVSVAGLDTRPATRMVREARAGQRLLDMTRGGAVRAIVTLDGNWIALVTLTPKAFGKRAAALRLEDSTTPARARA